MGARMMWEHMHAPAPEGKEKHHGNKRKSIQRMKVVARRVDRRKFNREVMEIVDEQR
jgi:hypothetical protein